MTPPKKPDWIEIADGDGEGQEPMRVKRKSRPILIAATALAVTFGGAVLAQVGDEPPAAADQSAVSQSDNSSGSVAPNRETSALQAAKRQSAKSATSVTAPAIATPPNMSRGGEDDDDDFRERDHDGGRGSGNREGHERGEREEHDNDFEDD